jgi:hypothetical protein
MSNFKFWSDSETNALITSIDKFQSVGKAAKWLSPRIGRSYGTVYQKGLYLINTNVINAPEKMKTRTVKEKKPAKVYLAIPKGFSFDFTPSRAEMCKDHVKLYF